MESVMNWRRAGLPVYFTIDAGPNVHLICEGKNEARVLDAAKQLKGVEDIIVNEPAIGTRVLMEHLF